jgi:hypothetical protein
VAVVVLVVVRLVVHLLHVAFIVVRTNAPSKVEDEVRPFPSQIKIF